MDVEIDKQIMKAHCAETVNKEKAISVETSLVYPKSYFFDSKKAHNVETAKTVKTLSNINDATNERVKAFCVETASTEKASVVETLVKSGSETIDAEKACCVETAETVKANKVETGPLDNVMDRQRMKAHCVETVETAKARKVETQTSTKSLSIISHDTMKQAIDIYHEVTPISNSMVDQFSKCIKIKNKEYSNHLMPLIINSSDDKKTANMPIQRIQVVDHFFTKVIVTTSELLPITHFSFAKQTIDNINNYFDNNPNIGSADQQIIRDYSALVKKSYIERLISPTK